MKYYILYVYICIIYILLKNFTDTIHLVWVSWWGGDARPALDSPSRAERHWGAVSDVLLTAKPVRLRSTGLEYMVMTSKWVAVSGNVGHGESTSAINVMAYGAWWKGQHREIQRGSKCHWRDISPWRIQADIQAKGYKRTRKEPRKANKSSWVLRDSLKDSNSQQIHLKLYRHSSLSQSQTVFALWVKGMVR